MSKKWARFDFGGRVKKTLQKIKFFCTPTATFFFRWRRLAPRPQLFFFVEGVLPPDRNFFFSLKASCPPAATFFHAWRGPCSPPASRLRPQKKSCTQRPKSPRGCPLEGGRGLWGGAPQNWFLPIILQYGIAPNLVEIWSKHDLKLIQTLWKFAPNLVWIWF